MAVKRLRLNSLESTIRTLARLVREYHADETADSRKFRDVLYGVSILISAMRLVKELEIEGRLRAVEDAFRGRMP